MSNHAEGQQWGFENRHDLKLWSQAGVFSRSALCFEHKEVEHCIGTEAFCISQTVETRGRRTAKTKRVFGNANSPGDAENNSCSPVPYEWGNCCTCNVSSARSNRGLGLAPVESKTLLWYRQQAVVSPSCRQVNYEFRSLLEETMFSCFLSSCPISRYFSSFLVSCPIWALSSTVTAERGQGCRAGTRSLSFWWFTGVVNKLPFF